MKLYEMFVELMSPYLNRELCFSFVMLVVFLLIAGAFKIYIHIKKKPFVLKPSHILFLGTGVAQAAIFWQVYNEVSNGLIRAVDSTVSTIKSFGFDNPSTSLINAIFFDEKGEPIADIARFSREYVSFVSVLMIAVTAFAALSIFKDTAAQLRYSIAFFKKAHIFSELNEKSICLARDVRKNNPFSRIVFTGVDRVGSNEASEGLVLEAENINAIMTRKSVLDFHIASLAQRNIYLINLEESDNIKNGIELYKKYKKKNCVINVFSTLESSESFIDGIKKDKSDKAVINLINRAQVIAYDLMMRYPMYKAADRCNSDTMSVLIIGAGTIGMECAKAAMWCGIMNTYKFKIRIVDTVDRKNEFSAKYSKFNDELKAVGIDSKIEGEEEDFYKFDVIDVNDSAFNEWLDSNSDANYIIVATGNDELNIITATKVRRRLIKKTVETGNKYNEDSEPLIIPIISNPDYYGIMDEISFKCSGFCPYGSHNNIYRYNTVNNWAIDKLAEKIHEKYRCIQIDRKDKCPSEKYNKLSQCDKRSSRANAVHIIYKLKDAGIELCNGKGSINADKLTLEYMKTYDFGNIGRVLDMKDGELTRRQALVSLEHDRWSVFNILDGWTSWNIDQIRAIHKMDESGKWKHKLETAMLHGSLVKTSELEYVGSELKKDKDYFIAYDRDLTKIAEEDFAPFVNDILSEYQEQNFARRLLKRIFKDKNERLCICVKNNECREVKENKINN